MAKPDTPFPPDRQGPFTEAAAVEQGEDRRAVLAKSWSRSTAGGAGHDQHHLPGVPLVGDELSDYRDNHPLASAVPVGRELLADAARDTGSVFAVADANGRLLWVEGDPAALRRTEKIHFVEGADWSEAEAGTNAPGTALVLGRPVQIAGDEHFNEAVRPWSCAAAPVHDPDSGRILGVVDLTGGPGVAAGHALALARATARAMQGALRDLLQDQDRLALEAFDAHQRPRSAPAFLLSPGGRVLHSDPEVLQDSRTWEVAAAVAHASPGSRLAIERVGPDGYLVVRLVDAVRNPGEGLRFTALGRDSVLVEIGERQVRLSPRHSEILLLLALAGEGLSAGRLAVELSLDALSTVAVRADMSRLRAVLGPTLLGSQPYRLRVSARGDVQVLTDLLADGRTAAALDVYAGPLLPSSQAPGIVEQRMVLEQQMRGAVLGSRDPRLVRRWVNQPWGADDLLAWETLARLLPANSPQRAAAVLRACSLRGVPLARCWAATPR